MILVAPPFRDVEILRRADSLIREFIHIVGINYVEKCGLSFDDIYEELIYPEYEIEIVEGHDLGYDEKGKKVLGLYDIQSNCVYIDNTLGRDSGDRRRVFTLYHEVVGHATLQGAYLRKQLAEIGHDFATITTEATIDQKTSLQLERQANIFAAHVSAPAWLVDFVLVRRFELRRPIRYIGPGDYTFFVAKHDLRVYIESFEHLCQYLAKKIEHYFEGLSTQSLGYRVQKSRYLLDCTKPRVALKRVAV